MKLTLQEAKQIMKANNGNLDFKYHTEITELPEELTVGGCLNIRGTKIKELPERLVVGGYLDISGTKIKELPEELTVERHFIND